MHKSSIHAVQPTDGTRQAFVVANLLLLPLLPLTMVSEGGREMSNPLELLLVAAAV